MDTTQKNREDADRRSRSEAPSSAQQRNGAARTPEEQRSAAARQRQASAEPAPAARPAQEQKKAAPKKRPAPEQKKAAPKKRLAPEQKKAAPKKRPAPEQKQTPPKKRPEQAQAAPKKRPASQQKQTGLPDSVSNKKRAYGNSKPKKKSAFATMMGNVAKAAAQKQEAKAKQAEKKKPKRPRQPAPAVIYTQPQAFNRNRLFVQLLTVVAVVVALVLGLSVFFKVENITVSGAEVYSAWTVREASGISEGDSLLTFSHARAGAKIKANLPYVDTVRFGIKLPDTVNIIIEEDDVVYAIQDANSQWWLMNSGGRVVEMCGSGKASNYTQILGVTLDSPTADTRAVATEKVPTETDPDTHELIPVTTSGAQRLTAALEIVRALEDNDIVGTAASVDVSSLEQIVLWYGTRYQVNLGEASQLSYKVTCMNDAILQLSDFQSGILDISFTIWPDRVIYTPFG